MLPFINPPPLFKLHNTLEKGCRIIFPSRCWHEEVSGLAHPFSTKTMMTFSQLVSQSVEEGAKTMSDHTVMR